MSSWWVTDVYDSQGIVVLVAWIFWVVFSITLHELSHGWTAMWCGDSTPRDLEHMTWNPLVHMGPMSLAMFALIGIAWGLMPVNPARFRRRYDDALVSAAGPAMNLLLAAACIVLLSLWTTKAGGGPGAWATASEPLFSNMKSFLWIGAMLNVVLVIFNLLPVPPLDGSRILGSFVPAFGRMMQTERGAVIALVIFVLVFMYSGGIIFSVAGEAVNRATAELIGLIRGGRP